MHLVSLVARNAVRSPLRTAITVLTVAIMLTAFAFPRTLIDVQEKRVRDAPNNRIVSLSKLGWSRLLPARYADEIRAMDGIRYASGFRAAGFKVAGKETQWFDSNAVDPEPFIAIHRELAAPDQQKRAFLEDERSAMVSVELAREFGWKLGDRLIFESRSLPGQWDFTLRCIYEPVDGEWAKRNMYVHYATLNRALSGDAKDKINLVATEIIEPDQAGIIARKMDEHFDAAPVRTLSMEARMLSIVNNGRIGAILSALDYVSYLILFVVLAILINTLSLNVRERTRELGVLRAIGFGPGYLYVFVLGEAAMIGGAGAALGLFMSRPLLEGLVGPYLQERLQFPPTEIPLRVDLLAGAAGLALSLLAAWIPAERLRRLEVHESLRRVA